MSDKPPPITWREVLFIAAGVTIFILINCFVVVV